MTLRRMLLLFGLSLLPLCAFAQGETRTYVIKKGDTLWGISQRFLKDPDYWPSLWANNPEIRNPHFVYPGQQVTIRDGRIEIVPAPPPPPATVTPEEALPVAVEAPPAEEAAAVTIHTMGGARGFVSQEELAESGILVDTVDNRILMAAGDLVFVKLADPAVAAPGVRFSLFEIGREVKHPLTDEPIGFQVTELGALQITEPGPSVATAQITASFREIQRGSRLLPYRPPVQEVALKKATQPLSGQVIAAAEGKIALSQYDVIHIDLGAADGLQVGNLLHVSRSRLATELAVEGETLQLPDVLLGTAVVLETQPHTAAALVLKSANAMYRGDRVTTVTE